MSCFIQVCVGAYRGHSRPINFRVNLNLWLTYSDRYQYGQICPVRRGPIASEASAQSDLHSSAESSISNNYRINMI
ncbi:hypothetical protein B5X24_HaOG207666 [Helicoverpa armigera]|uniref:Uncharacterized protein n=1 Tax=Helicoverpa armigera TaxID=29058 RepID=A0A2W1BLP0_HELAM|nr:hypothetical protein B5X24_HaOG207666 [Helicoverpa armigera]